MKKLEIILILNYYYSIDIQYDNMDINIEINNFIEFIIKFKRYSINKSDFNN